MEMATVEHLMERGIDLMLFSHIYWDARTIQFYTRGSDTVWVPTNLMDGENRLIPRAASALVMDSSDGDTELLSLSELYLHPWYPDKYDKIVNVQVLGYSVPGYDKDNIQLNVQWNKLLNGKIQYFITADNESLSNTEGPVYSLKHVLQNPQSFLPNYAI